MPFSRINDLSKSELHDLIVEAQLRKLPRERACLLCGKVVHMRPDQNFCSSKCRVTYHREAVKIAEATFIKERDEWRRQEKLYLDEIQDLKQHLTTLQQQLERTK